MQLTEQFLAVRDKFYGKVRQARLSQSAIDVLSVVAYNQPVTRAEVDEYRDVASTSAVGPSPAGYCSVAAMGTSSSCAPQISRRQFSTSVAATGMWSSSFCCTSTTTSRLVVFESN